MANLSIENLNRLVQTGDIESMMGAQKTISAESPKSLTSGISAETSDGGKTFSDILRSSMEQVNEYQHQADTAIKELVAGRSKNIHETMLAIERADTSLKLMMQVRNKILDAYKEVMRMQV